MMLADIQTLSKHATKNKRQAAKAPGEAQLVEKIMSQLDQYEAHPMHSCLSANRLRDSFVRPGCT